MTFPYPAGGVYVHALRLLATTGAAGFSLQNGTPNMLSWTAPNDGQLHRVMLVYLEHVTVAKTGGQVTFGSQNAGGAGTITPDGVAAWSTVANGGETTGARQAANVSDLIVGPGRTVFLFQASALTLGASIAWAEIWGG
jgi:hypothetical protein